MVYLIIFPLLGALIGWLTNRLALKFLFWPARPRRVGFFVLHGVVPRRRRQLALTAGRIIAEELLTQGQIAETLRNSTVRTELAKRVGRTVAAHVASHGALSLLPPQARQAIERLAAGGVEKEVSRLLARESGAIARGMLQTVDFAALVEKKLLAMDWEEMEQMVLAVAGRELSHIELMGAVLGGLIGLIQAAVFLLIS